MKFLLEEIEEILDITDELDSFRPREYVSLENEEVKNLRRFNRKIKNSIFLLEEILKITDSEYKRETTCGKEEIGNIAEDGKKSQEKSDFINLEETIATINKSTITKIKSSDSNFMKELRMDKGQELLSVTIGTKYLYLFNLMNAKLESDFIKPRSKMAITALAFSSPVSLLFLSNNILYQVHKNKVLNYAKTTIPITNNTCIRYLNNCYFVYSSCTKSNIYCIGCKSLEPKVFLQDLECSHNFIMVKSEKNNCLILTKKFNAVLLIEVDRSGETLRFLQIRNAYDLSIENMVVLGEDEDLLLIQNGQGLMLLYYYSFDKNLYKLVGKEKCEPNLNSNIVYGSVAKNKKIVVDRTKTKFVIITPSSINNAKIEFYRINSFSKGITRVTEHEIVLEKKEGSLKFIDLACLQEIKGNLFLFIVYMLQANMNSERYNLCYRIEGGKIERVDIGISPVRNRVNRVSPILHESILRKDDGFVFYDTSGNCFNVAYHFK